MLYKNLQKSFLLNKNTKDTIVVIVVNKPYKIELSLNKYVYIVRVSKTITYIYNGNLII